MICYSLDVLKSFEIQDVAVVVSPDNCDLFRAQLGDGAEFGMNITYIIQEVAQGNAGAFKLARDYVGVDDVVLVFGDNIFAGDLMQVAQESLENLKKGYASIFAYNVSNPKAYGVLEVDENENVITIEEKPENPKSNLIAPGLYVYNCSVFDKIDQIKKSSRGEYEITDVNNLYLAEHKLKAVKLSDLCKWYDAGNVDILLQAANEIKEYNESKVI